MINKYLDHPMAKFLIVAIFSTGAALLFWKLGDSTAKVVVPGSKVWGLGMELGGAIAGFVAVYCVSVKVVERFHRLTPSIPSHRAIRVFLVPRATFATGNYSAAVTIYNSDTGEERSLRQPLRRENGHLTLDLRELADKERFTIEVSNASQNWKSDYHQVSTATVELNPA